MERRFSVVHCFPSSIRFDGTSALVEDEAAPASIDRNEGRMTRTARTLTRAINNRPMSHLARTMVYRPETFKSRERLAHPREDCQLTRHAKPPKNSFRR